MIIHRLIWRHLKAKDDPRFYLYQAEDAIQWLVRFGVRLGPGVSALDLGCGHGIFGTALRRMGCEVTFADLENGLPPDMPNAAFKKINLNQDALDSLGAYDVVVCSNVLEHLANPANLLENMGRVVTPGGFFYLSWTNWLSPWGGHSFSPFHYFGPHLGPKLFDRIFPSRRKEVPFHDLFPTYIGKIIGSLKRHPEMRLRRIVPRYYPEFSLITKIPVAREFLTWNCAVLLEKHNALAAGR